MAGHGEAMQQLAALIHQVASTDISVLITGESGTGKELVARAVHESSPRSKREMITVNCGAIPEGIFESEVFGHERGAFTGADRQRRGMFELADGGTIFLDEIGEMPLLAQVKILRVLETGEFMRVGGQSPIRVKVRVVAATNRDLAREVSEGRFRQDLYFRLKAVTVSLPPLRDRPEDIPELVHFFASRFAQENALPIPTFLPEAMQIISQHYWEGNVRELKNFTESMLILSDASGVDAAQVRARLGDNGTSAHLPVLSTHRSHPETVTFEALQQMFFYLQRELLEIKVELKEMNERQSEVSDQMDMSAMSVEELEREHIREVLADYAGNRARAAQSLGFSERTLYRKIRRYGL
jgi:two-component system, NtrC family, response regulator